MSAGPTLFDLAIKPQFDGATYEPDRDNARLSSMLQRVKDVMLDGRWHTLAELARLCDGSEAGVSARLRDLRKPKFGGLLVEREYVVTGLHRYRVVAETSAS